MGWNDLRDDEKPFVERLQALRDARTAAMKAYAEVARGCPHRMRQEEPIVNHYNGALLYPDNPTCLLCGEFFEFEGYCHESPKYMCMFLPKGDAKPSTAEELHDRYLGRDVTEEEQERLAVAECIFCHQPWDRSR
jgi:hypothetical protein